MILTFVNEKAFPNVFGKAICSIEVEKLLEFLVKRDAQYQRELRGRVELPRFDRAYRVARHSDQICKLGL